MKKKVENEKGITLVALVITIIILLILAGISISALTNTGIFQKAKDAKQSSENAEKEQNKILDEYETALDQYDEKTLVYKVNNGTIKIGDYISYIPDAASTDEILEELKIYSGSTNNTTSTLRQEELKWRVLDVKDGKVRLISATPTNQDKTNAQNTIALSGAKGYNNAVYLLDKTCKTLYNNSKLASNVQNLKIEDIQDHLTYDYKQYQNSNVDTGKYGGMKEYTTNKNYPNIFAKEKTGCVDGTQGTELNLSEQTVPINETKTTAKEKIKVTQTYWYKAMTLSDFKNSIYYDLFINNGSNYNAYWTSSRCSNVNSAGAGFYVRYVNSGEIGAGSLCISGNDEYSGTCAFRPVITLNSDVQVTSGDGSESAPFEIK